MDVRPAPDTGQPPVMDVVPPATETPPAPIPPTAPAPKADQPSPPPKPVATTTRPNPNVVAAIIATVIIVFGLAALAVYAYLKQNQ